MGGKRWCRRKELTVVAFADVAIIVIYNSWTFTLSFDKTRIVFRPAFPQVLWRLARNVEVVTIPYDTSMCFPIVDR